MARTAEPPAALRNRIVGYEAAVDPTQLTANPKNWRMHPKAQREALRGTLREVGWVDTVLVNTTTGHVVDGHARLEEAIASGSTVPVIYVELSEADEALVLATFDPIAAMADTDQAKLNALLAEVVVDDDGLRGLLAGLGKFGLDLRWRDEVYNKLGPAERPYMQVGHQNATISGDTRVDWSEAFELVPSIDVGYVWHGGTHAAAVAEGLVRIGFEIVSQIIWDKGLFAMGRSWYHWAHEPCWVVRRKGAKVPFLARKRNQSTVWHEAARLRGELAHPATCCIHPSTVWQAPSPKMIMAGSREAKFDHPAQKPIVTAQIPITNHLEAGEAVYDPFLGSGTTLMAAETLGRRCYGFELEPRYAQLVIERWEAYTGRKAERLDG